MVANKSHELTTLDGTCQALAFGSAGASGAVGVASAGLTAWALLSGAAAGFFFHDTLAFLSMHVYIHTT